MSTTTAEAELQRKNERLELLLNLTTAIASSLDLREILRAIAANIRAVIHADAVTVWLPDAAALSAFMAFAGLGWLTFLYAPFASYLSPYNIAPGMIGEGALTLWLLAKVVDEGRWNALAATRRH